jgi:hypothetical protein
LATTSRLVYQLLNRRQGQVGVAEVGVDSGEVEREFVFLREITGFAGSFDRFSVLAQPGGNQRFIAIEIRVIDIRSS